MNATRRPTTISRDRSTDRAAQHALWLPMACALLLMLATFSLPEGDAANSFATLDVFGMFKLAVRVATLGLLGLMLLRHFNNPQRAAAMRWLTPLGLFAAWALLSTLWSPLKAVSLGQASGLIVLLMLSLVLALLCNGQRSTSTALQGLSLGLLAVSVILLAARFFFPATESLSRDGAGLFHSTNAGGAASLGLILLVAARLLWKWRWTRLLLAPGVVIHVAVLLLAASRVPTFLTVAALLVVYFAFANRTMVLASVVAGSIAGVIYLTLDVHLVLAEQALQGVAAFAEQNQSKIELRELSGRAEMWQAMWNSHRQSPWIGHGYFVTSKRGELQVWYEWANWTAHNLILQVLVSTGLVGLVLFAFGLLSPAWLLCKRAMRGRADRALVFFLLLIGGWYFLRGLLSASFMGPIQPESVVFFVVMGVGVGSLLSVDASQGEPSAAAGAAPRNWRSARFAR